QAPIVTVRGHANFAALAIRSNSELDAVLDKSLNRKRRNLQTFEAAFDFHSPTQPRSQARLLDLEIVPNDLHFLLEADKPAAMRIQSEAQQRRHTLHHALCAHGIRMNQRRDGIESVEQKVRMKARLERT